MSTTVETHPLHGAAGPRPGDARGATDFRADRTGFLDAVRARLPGDEWLDIVEWRSAADFAASRAKGANPPGVTAFFDTIAALVVAEEGEPADWPRRIIAGDGRSNRAG